MGIMLWWVGVVWGDDVTIMLWWVGVVGEWEGDVTVVLWVGDVTVVL